MPQEFVQLGVAGVIVVILGYILKLIIDGRLHTDAEIAVRDTQIKDRDARIADLIGQTSTLTNALASANEQARAIISLWKALQSEDEGDYDGGR